MGKKIIAIILVVGLVAIATGVFFIFNKDDDAKNEGAARQQGVSAINKDGKAIVVYFSAQNHTKNVATIIAALREKCHLRMRVEKFTEAE